MNFVHLVGRGVRLGLRSAVAISALAPMTASALELEAEASFQGRIYQNPGEQPGQQISDASIAALIDWDWTSQDRSQSAMLSVFGRHDGSARNRGHADVRELYWARYIGDWDIRLGVSKVFWGKTELLHLVDVINQDDALENLDLEDKLGQPMLRVSYRVPNGQLTGFVLPYFRERAFVAPNDRQSIPLPVAESQAIYESSAEESHVDWALRWQGYAGPLDFGIAHFSGTARDPQLVPDDNASPTVLLPVYALMEQTSIDAQLTQGNWLWKLEALYRDTAVLAPGPQGPVFIGDRFGAATGGFEYTFYGLNGSAMDLGVLAEYLWDERNLRSDQPFQNDLFVAGRLALNDVASTAILGGVVMDLDYGSRFLNLEATTRLDSSTAMSIQARIFSNTDLRDTRLYAGRNEDYVELEITRYF